MLALSREPRQTASMTSDGDNAKLDWIGDVPVSRQHADPYYARSDGLAETRHVYLAGNDLAQRFAIARTFDIGELGFGTGLSFLAVWQLWEQTASPGAVLNFTSVEKSPLSEAEMARALGAWPELAPWQNRLLARWTPAGGTVDLGTAHLTVLIGDVADHLPVWPRRADAWFLDGFAPSRNPDMWTPEVLNEVARHSAPGATFATYTAAGHVRRALAAAGFMVEKRPGFGTKRDMSIGTLGTATR